MSETLKQLDRKIPKKHDPKHYDGMNGHVLFAVVTLLSAIPYVWGLTTELAVKILFTFIALTVQSALWKWDFGNMIKRRLFIESFFTDTEEDKRAMKVKKE